MQVFQLTPFIETILTMVTECCGPSLPDWERCLCDQLWQHYYCDAVAKPGKPVEAEQDLALHVRLMELESRMRPTGSKAPVTQRAKDLTNYRSTTVSPQSRIQRTVVNQEFEKDALDLEEFTGMRASQLTPFIENILTMVKKCCDPSLPNWEFSLCKRLWRRYYCQTVAKSGEPVESEQNLALHFRLVELESRMRPTGSKAAITQRGKVLTNYES
jgi:hypothetical protein